MLTNRAIGLSDNVYWWLARLIIALMLVILYGWTVYEPYAGDALMHMMDDTEIHSLGDVFRIFYRATNPAYHEQHRLTAFHRPVFNELYVTVFKGFFGVGSIWLRVITLAMLVGTAWAFLSLVQKMKLSPWSGAIGAAWLVFSPALFFGLYEFGLAFSQLLVLLAVLSLLVLKKYIDCREQPNAWLWISGALFLVFLVVFTKESAVVWPFIFLLMAIYFAIESDQQATLDKSPLSLLGCLKLQFVNLFTARWLILALISIVVLYFATRYIKLGSLTAIAGGIEQAPSIGDALFKFGGYSLLSMQIPNAAIPPYMTQGLWSLGWVEITIRLLLLISALWAIWSCWQKSRLFTITILAAFLLAFLPIIKVSRNAPYYGDLMVIPLAIALAFGFEAIKGKIRANVYTIISILIIASLFITGGFFASRYIYNADMWLARTQGFARSALSDFSSAEGATEAKQIVGTSGMFSPEQRWALNHNPALFGSAFIVNLGIPKERFVVNSEKLLQNDKVLFVDFNVDMHPRKVGAYPLPGYGRLITAYFPTGFIRKALQSADGTFNISGSKVIRLECDNPFQKPFDVVFKSYPESELSRRVDEAMSISSSPDRMVLEFVAPSNAVSLRLVSDAGGGCLSPKAIGYFPFDPSSLNYSTIINASPRFEKDSDWNGKMARNPQGAGVVVGPGADNPNVLSQRVPVKPFEPLKIVARASSVHNSNATGRLQINWVGKDDQFISSSGRSIVVGRDEQSYETFVVAPANAMAGILYVTPHAPDDIVQYTEMKLLRVQP